MNKTITLSELAAQIAELTHCTAEDAENFVRETFRLAAETLESQRMAEITGIGTFIVADDKISYAPDAALAAELNAPFSAFEAIELPDDYVQEPTSDNKQSDNEVMIESSGVISEQTADNVSNEINLDAQDEIADAAEFEEQEDAAPQPEIDEPTQPKPKGNQNYYHWIWAVACIICFALGWFARGYVPVMPQPETTAQTETDEIYDVEISTDSSTEIASDTAAPVSTVVQPQIITDTITPTRYLTTMARKHYGQMEYWVYIYEANSDKLGHPDRLEAGTVVTIPQLNFGANNEEKIAEAKQLAKQIYARFN